MMDWTYGIGKAISDQRLTNSVYRQVAPMSHLVFYWFCHEIRVASMGRLLPAYAAWFRNSLDARTYLGTAYH